MIGLIEIACLAAVVYHYGRPHSVWGVLDTWRLWLIPSLVVMLVFFVLGKMLRDEN